MYNPPKIAQGHSASQNVTSGVFCLRFFLNAQLSNPRVSNSFIEFLNLPVVCFHFEGELVYILTPTKTPQSPACFLPRAN